MHIDKFKGRVLTRDLLEEYCRGLVVLRNDEVYIAHGSVRTYLLDGALGKLTVHYSNPPVDLSIQSGLGTACLGYLSSMPVPDKPEEVWNVETIRTYPFARYAISCWYFHVFSATGVNIPQLRSFLLSSQSLLW
jgi:hypothetical protein